MELIKNKRAVVRISLISFLILASIILILSSKTTQATGSCTPNSTQVGNGTCAGIRTCLANGTWGSWDYSSSNGLSCGSTQYFCDETTSCAGGYSHYYQCNTGVCEEKTDLNDETGCAGKVCGACIQSGCGIIPDGNWNTLDYLIDGTKTCNSAGSCSTSSCQYDHVCSDSDLFDDYPLVPDYISVSACNAACDQDSDCQVNSCVGNIRNYNGICNLEASCKCTYSQEDCNAKDGWYDNQTTQWINTDQCNEKEQKGQDYRDYSCAPAECIYIVTGNQWVNTGETRYENPETICDDGLACTLSDHCSLGQCVGSQKSCVEFDIAGIAMCKNNPDNNSLTWDSRNSFTSVCEESTGLCKTGDETVTSACSVSSCNAQCDATTGCANYCDGSNYYTGGSCDLTGCTCNYNLPQNCDGLDCSGQFSCVGIETNTISENGDDYSCSTNGCGITGTKTCGGTWTCDVGNQCNRQLCASDNPTCYNNGDGFVWGTPSTTELSCNDGFDNDCDGKVDCADPDCDKTAPDTTKTYGTPAFPININDPDVLYPHYVNSSTPITLVAVDNLSSEEQCVSDQVTVYYRHGVVNSNYCGENSTSKWITTSTESPGWIEYTSPFTMNESCHVIEFYSTDTLGNDEIVNYQFVFVDSSGPEAIKLVGEPKEPWNGLDANFYDLDNFCGKPGKCWRTTLLTPISLTCEDKEPHPVGNKYLYFKVELDGDDATATYCENYEEQVINGYCRVETNSIYPFYFNEVSEHNLEFYCEDILGNIGEKHDEKFKVEETAFTIDINQKWNLISVPVKLLDDSMDAVFDSPNNLIKSVWQYDGVNWHSYTPDGNSGNDGITTMEPGWGYWILADNDTNITIGGSLMSPAMTPPSRDVVAGWNLLGYYGAEGLSSYNGPVGEGDPADCVFNSLGTSFWSKGFTSLWTYWEPDNPNSWKPLAQFSNLDPGAGYWVFAQERGIYAPSTICGFS